MLVVLIVLMLAANHIFVEIVDLVWLDTHDNFLLQEPGPVAGSRIFFQQRGGFSPHFQIKISANKAQQIIYFLISFYKFETK